MPSDVFLMVIVVGLIVDWAVRWEVQRRVNVELRRKGAGRANDESGKRNDEGAGDAGGARDAGFEVTVRLVLDAQERLLAASGVKSRRGFSPEVLGFAYGMALQCMRNMMKKAHGEIREQHGDVQARKFLDGVASASMGGSMKPVAELNIDQNSDESQDTSKQEQ